VNYKYSAGNNPSRIYSCNTCTLMFLSPVVLAELDDRRMDAVDDAELFNNPLLKRLYESFIVKKEIRKVRKKLGNGPLSLLDIGCGTGWTTSIWKKEGFDVTGVEPSQQRGEYAKEKYGIRIISGYVENVPVGEKFDVIVIRHVLEHFESPFPVLQNIRNLLKKNGLLVVIVPNLRCIGRYLFNTNWTWVLPWHCNFFNPRSLRNIISLSGFTVLNSYQTPSPLWYPESFLRAFSRFNLITKAYNKLSILFFVPFVPVIAMGYFTGFSENLTIMAENDASSAG
jgi:SAM-dependent methyltransferase